MVGLILKARFLVSEAMLEKLATKHRVTRDEVRQCFENREGGFLEDDREDHQTDPPTQWFVAETNQCRKLKIAFVQGQTEKGPHIEIKTAYDANADEIAIYDRHGKC